MTGGRELVGTGRLVRLAVHQDRVRFVLWLVGISAMVVISGSSLRSLYPDAQAIADYVSVSTGNPAIVAFSGPGYGFGDPNIGVVLVNETALWGAMGAAFMSVFVLARLTRGEEDCGRTELVRSNVLGRHAPIAAATVVTVVMNAILVLLIGGGLVWVGYSPVGSFALAGQMGLVGAVFGGIAAMAAQIASSHRAALGIACSAIGVAFVLRAVGDVGNGVLSWGSPFGWGIGVRAFAGERWWTLALAAIATALAFATGIRLSTVRDLGSGLVPQRPGRPRATRWMRGPLGLAVRLQRGPVIGWTIGMALYGAAVGSIGNDIEDMLADNPQLADFIAQYTGATLTDAYFATVLGMMAMMVCGFAIATVLRMRTEETAGRCEPLLAGPVARERWMASHVLVAIVGSVLITVAGGLGIGVADAIVVDDAGEVPRMTVASLATLPAVLVVIGVSCAVFALVPRWTMTAWVLLAYITIAGVLGNTLDLPQWALDVSPLTHVPAAPAEAVTWLPVLALVAVGLAAVAAGVTGFRRRDVASV